MHYTSSFLRKSKNKKGNCWIGVLSYKENGKWKQKTKTFSECKYKRDAKQALEEWRTKEESKANLLEKKQTLQDAVENYLSKERALGIISPRTYSDNLRAARKVIFPRIGELVFTQATQEQIQNFVTEISKIYKPSTVRTYFAIIGKTYKDALRTNRVLKDVTKDVSLPKYETKRINYLDKDGRKKFLATIDENSQFYLPAMIAYYTGMRAGEICGLRWKDINLSIRTIFVEYAAKDYTDADTGERVQEIGDTKTHKTRTITIRPRLKEILEEKLKEKNPNPEDLVCETKKPALLCTSFQKWAKRNQILGTLGKPITMHGLRHTFATVGVQSGMDIRSLASILGHENVSMTLNTYASDDAEAKVIAMDRLDEYMTEEEENDL